MYLLLNKLIYLIDIVTINANTIKIIKDFDKLFTHIKR